MQLADFVSGCLDQHFEAMIRSVHGLSEDEMQWAPTPECSSIGFLVWHYGRTLDRWIHSRLQGVPQLWEQGWAARLGQDMIEPNDTGYGYGREELAAFLHPDRAVLLDYAAATLDAAKEFLATMDDSDFDRKNVVNPRGGAMTLGNMCQQFALGVQPARRADRISARHAKGSGGLFIQRRTTGRARSEGGFRWLIPNCCWWCN